MAVVLAKLSTVVLMAGLLSSIAVCISVEAVVAEKRKYKKQLILR